MNYYYLIDGTDVLGPLPGTEILAAFRSGALPNTTKVCAEGEQDWHQIQALVPPQARAPQTPNREQHVVSLKCVSCGAALDITIDMDVFACAYCGTQQVVKRSGGAVSLRLVREAISRVQRGTDRTAAELAIRRINEELLGIAKERKERKGQICVEDASRGCMPLFMGCVLILFCVGLANLIFPHNEDVVMAAGVIISVVSWVIFDSSLRNHTNKRIALSEREFDARVSKLQKQLARNHSLLETDEP